MSAGLNSLAERVTLAKHGAPLVWSRVTYFDPTPKHYGEPILEAQAHDGVNLLADVEHCPLRPRGKRYEVRVFGGGPTFNHATPERAFATMEREAVKEWKRRNGIPRLMRDGGPRQSEPSPISRSVP